MTQAGRNNETDPQNGTETEERNPEAALNDQDPGQRQKENQNKQKDDPLAA